MQTYIFKLVNNFFRLEGKKNNDEIEEIRNIWLRGEIEIKSTISGEKGEIMTWKFMRN